MRTKQEIRDQLFNNGLFQKALLSGTEEDRKKIEGAVAPMLVDIISQMDEFVEKVKNDPAAQAELMRGLSSAKEVVNSEGPLSGSKE